VGIQFFSELLDSRIRGNDGKREFGGSENDQVLFNVEK
jgi:hypothetical protein